MSSHLRIRSVAPLILLLAALFPPLRAGDAAPGEGIDFNRDIRPILSGNCLRCHGPDRAARQGGGKAGLRLDVESDATHDLGGYAAIVPGHPESSELLRRITAEDPDDRMPPPEAGKKLGAKEIALLERWIRAGAPYARHWSYVPPVRPELPDAGGSSWPRNPIDHFVLARLGKEGLEPSPEADRYALIRRVTLDITGLPPTIEEVDAFVADRDPRAYERLVERLLFDEAYGEHWARMWLDLARYADSAGYADDPPRTIWGYRDWVIRALNDGEPFDEFTIEQIAGDLLPNADEEDLVATAFHRNTLTNNEGGTNDEEFRNVAIVDRVNTTMAVWMGTTINCAQCHDHKYDPISQEEFFRFFAIFNNTADADRRDESPFVEVWSDEDEAEKRAITAEIERLETILATPTPELAAEESVWERGLGSEPSWSVLTPRLVETESGAAPAVREDASIVFPSKASRDVYTLEFRLENGSADANVLTALRLETLTDASLPNGGPGHAAGNYVVTRVAASIVPPSSSRTLGRFVRIDLPGNDRILSLAEVEVFSGEENVARRGQATQSSTAFNGPPELAIDGNTNGDFDAKSTTHTATENDPWWELDLGAASEIDRIAIWNRTDNRLQGRLAGARVSVLDPARNVVWESTIAEAPEMSAMLSTGGARELALTRAFADVEQNGFPARAALESEKPDESGWAIAPEQGKPHSLTLVLGAPVPVPPRSTLLLRVEQRSAYEHHTIGRLRVSATGAASVAGLAEIPGDVLAIVRKPVSERSDAERVQIEEYFRSIAPSLADVREDLAKAKSRRDAIKPTTTVPVMRSLPEGERRETHIQHRGNFLDTGRLVMPGVPAVFHSLPGDRPPDRLALARWLVDEKNPLTARVLVNRYWEKIFGVGIVRTSEEFGSQGELPSHPELLDWLATEVMRSGWDLRHLLRLLVTSSTYRQSARVTPELVERDPDNRLLARGPRFRMSAEMIRDQALFASGLLSRKMYGPPVRPPQPELGVSAAFGGGIDWQTSMGEDRYRRAIYTTWRRSNPYPSMSTFDAPNREVCTVRRDRTNTPLQALVTLNDPVYVEAAQALARRMASGGSTLAEKIRHGFRLCLGRPPSDAEAARLVELGESLCERFASDRTAAEEMATKPLGPPPEGADIIELASLTVVANVLLNLDEIFLKR